MKKKNITKYDSCEKSFTESGTLKIHINTIHEGEGFITRITTFIYILGPRNKVTNWTLKLFFTNLHNFKICDENNFTTFFFFTFFFKI